MQKLLQHLIQECVYLLLLPLDILIPKRKDWWVFTAKDRLPWCDNMRSMVDRTLLDESITTIILLSGREPRPDIEKIYKDAKVIVARRASAAGVWYFLRSKVCFIAYSNFDLFSVIVPQFRHIIINLWHGVPIKSIAMAEPKNANIQRKILNPHYKFCNYIISSSHVDRLAMSACMMHNPNNVWITGLPRNDLMFNQTQLPDDLVTEELRLLKVLSGKKLMLYAPTFRDSQDSSNSFSSQKILSKLASLAKEHDFVLGIRKHPIDSSLKIDDVYGVLDCNSMVYSNPQILLRNTEILITDYSGIWLDYLLLDKPIIGFCYDFEEYMSDRSFLYDFEGIFPGKVAKTEVDFITTVAEALAGKDTFKQKRKTVSDMFLYYKDNKATERVFQNVINVSNCS